MTRQVSPTVTMLTQDTLQKFKDSNPVVVIMETHINSPEYLEFHKVAEKLHYTYLFGMLDSAVPKLTIYKKFDEGIDQFREKFNELEITRFLTLFGSPLIPVVGPNNYEELFAKGLPMPHFYYENEEQRKQYSLKLEEIASKLKQDFQFVYLDVSKFRGVMMAHGLVPPFPAFSIVDGRAGSVFYLNRGEKLNIEGVGKFLEDFKQGKLKPTLRSDPEPKSNNRPVMEVVGTTFEKIVLDRQKDVLLVVYSPSCIYCRRMEAAYEQLGAEVKSKDIVIARLNGKTNETPMPINSYPTIILFKANTNEMVHYNGDRSVGSFKAFLKESAVYGNSISAETHVKYVQVDEKVGPADFADRFDHLEL